MKELQRKKTEKKRQLKKKKKMLKLKRERERLEKETSIQSEKTPDIDGAVLVQTPNPCGDLETPNTEIKSHISPERKNSLKSVGLEEINEILRKDNSDLLDGPGRTYNFDDGGDDIMAISDADILTSLTAPIQLNDFEGATSWRRRQSMVEAAAENLRFTKSGLFSESALADIEGIMGNGSSSGAFEFNEALQ